MHLLMSLHLIIDNLCTYATRTHTGAQTLGAGPKLIVLIWTKVNLLSCNQSTQKTCPAWTPNCNALHFAPMTAPFVSSMA